MAVGEDGVWRALKQVRDPEIGLNIVELGLVYALSIDGAGDVDIVMTLTTPGCPLHDGIEEAVQRALGMVPGVGRIHVEVVWAPPWSPEMITAEGRAALGGV